jgi:hypothetical protein
MTTDFRPYPIATIRIDWRTGALELWKGERDIAYRSKVYADVFIQDSVDIKEILNSLPYEQQQDLDHGWAVHTYFLSDEYFS